MAVFEIVHGLSALLGLGATLSLFGPWTDRFWELKAAMWVGAVGAIGSGVVISLSYVGTGIQILSPMLLGKVALSVVLAGLMYDTLAGADSTLVESARPRLLVIAGLWIALLAAGVVVAM